VPVDAKMQYAKKHFANDTNRQLFPFWKQLPTAKIQCATYAHYKFSPDL
jgi:hypothetical protein